MKSLASLPADNYRSCSYGRHNSVPVARIALTSFAGGCTKELGHEPRSWSFNLDDYVVLRVRECVEQRRDLNRLALLVDESVNLCRL
jgi:hypothetical protein